MLMSCSCVVNHRLRALGQCVLHVANYVEMKDNGQSGSLVIVMLKCLAVCSCMLFCLLMVMHVESVACCL